MYINIAFADFLSHTWLKKLLQIIYIFKKIFSASCFGFYNSFLAASIVRSTENWWPWLLPEKSHWGKWNIIFFSSSLLLSHVGCDYILWITFHVLNLLKNVRTYKPFCTGILNNYQFVRTKTMTCSWYWGRLTLIFIWWF